MESTPLRAPPKDPMVWRAEIKRSGAVLQLGDVVSDLWDRGIPVVHVATLPTPSFQGLAAIVEGRPVIVLAHDLDEPARLAFIVAHEVAHIVNGDCSPDQPVVDDEEEVADQSSIEQLADNYATAVLTGGIQIPEIQASQYKELAIKAAEAEKTLGVDASSVVWAWARKNGNYGLATRAAQALYRTKGGKRILRLQFDQHVDLDATSDSDRTLLRCLHGDPQSDAAAS
jgi:Zn-dependent peptidase ImmA (M78 family)